MTLKMLEKSGRLRGLKKLAFGLLVAASNPCYGADEGAFTLIKVDLRSEDLRLFWQDKGGVPFRQFSRIASELQAQGKQLVVGMNAGMYHADAWPVGLLVIDGVQQSPLNLSPGTGNFFLKPNGVFFVSKGVARVVDAADYAAAAKDVQYATQSGPLLLKGGRIHPAFNPASTSRLIRNGVCASGTSVFFVITEKPVNFHEFATYFRDELHCQEALYLDGVVSSLYDTSLKRHDQVARLGPIFGVVK